MLIGEKLVVEGLTKMLDTCLLSRAETRKWEKVIFDEKMENDAKEESLTDDMG